MAYSGLTRPQFVLTAHLIMYVNYMHISNQINSWGNSGPSTKWNIARSYLNAFLLQSYIKWSLSENIPVYLETEQKLKCSLYLDIDKS